MLHVMTWLNRIQFHVCAIAVVAMGLLVTAEVAGRYAGQPIPGARDVVALLLLASVVLSFSLTQARGGQIAVDLVIDRFGYGGRIFFLMVVEIIGLVIAIAIAWLFMPFGAHAYVPDAAKEWGHIPLYPFKFLVFLGGLAWAAQYAAELLYVAARLLRRPVAPARDHYIVDLLQAWRV